MVRISRDTHTAEELFRLARDTKESLHARRLRALALVLEGCSRGLAARSQGVDTQTLADWVRRYNEEGPEGLRGKPSGGSACRLDAQQLETVRGWMQEGPDLERDGLTRWRVADIAGKIRESFGVEYTVEGVRRLLRRMGFRHVSARPLRPKADTERQAEFRADFTKPVRNAIGKEAEGKPVEVRFQDEARVGQKGALERVRAPKNTRPRIRRDHRYGYCCLFGAACASRGETAGLAAVRANTESMNAHLAAISEAVAEGARGVLVPDGAGWHESGGLVIPGNLTLLFLPPYSPELNPMEQVFQFLRGNRFSNRVFVHVEAVRTACEEAWDWLSATPSRIASIMRRQWVATAEADHLATC